MTDTALGQRCLRQERCQRRRASLKGSAIKLKSCLSSTFNELNTKLRIYLKIRFLLTAKKKQEWWCLWSSKVFLNVHFHQTNFNRTFHFLQNLSKGFIFDDQKCQIQFALFCNNCYNLETALPSDQRHEYQNMYAFRHKCQKNIYVYLI